MRIDVEEIRRITEEYRRINDYRLTDIELYENGEKLEIDPKIMDDWRFVGLSLSWFIETDFYKNGWTEVEDFTETNDRIGTEKTGG